MPGKWQFFLDREDADPDATLAFDRRITRQDESGLGKIHFASQDLHHLLVEPASVGEHCQGIAFERARGEDIQLQEGKAASLGGHDDLL